MVIDTYKASCDESRLVSVLTEVVAGWMNSDYKRRYREAITNAVRRLSADFVTLLPDAEGCQGCAGRRAGYCPTCKSVIVMPCPLCGASEVDAEGWKDGKGDSGPQCLQCGATGESIEIWNSRDWLIDRMTNAIDDATRKGLCATHEDWQALVAKVLNGENDAVETRPPRN